ncbi:HTH-type quorum sensing-dependent transcriptional regulator RpaR [Alphaproteobacteria bacterium SO-S41]|nr:HTH-type quorum sensing-dependent transcriptional regulator RpaR [Alphaproteobacteria bacterium SO-S41]
MTIRPEPFPAIPRSQSALQFVDDWSDGGALPAALTAFEQAIAAFGLRAPCAAYSIGFGTGRTCKFLFNRLPEPLRSLFVGEIDVHGDPVVAASISRHRPFTFLELGADASAGFDLETVGALALQCGVIDGVVVPVHGPFGYLGMVAMVSAEPVALSPGDEATLAAAARCLFDIARRAANLETVSRTARLTPRERESMSLVAMGQTDDQIARTLGVAASTVRHHIDNARAKLDASSRAEAVALLAVSGEI